MTVFPRSQQPLWRGLIVLAILASLIFLFLAVLPDENEDTRLTQLVALVLIGYLAGVVIFLLGLLPMRTRLVLVGLTFLQILWVAMYMLNREEQTFLGWFFDPNTELSSGPIFNSTILLLIGLTALFNGYLVNGILQRLYWLIMGLGFIFLATDEYFSYHETVNLWRTLYLLTGASIVGLSVLVYWFRYRHELLPFALLIIGFGTIGFAGVMLDAFANDSYIEFGSFEFNEFRCGHYKFGVACQDYPIIEEFLEMVGASLILVGFVKFAAGRVTNTQRRHGAGVIGLIAVVWVVFTLCNLWLIPTAEARLMAEDIRVEYGDLLLVGYEVSTDTIQPGDTVTTTLYFQSEKALAYNYFLSVHLLAKPTEETFIQFDLQLGQWAYPSSAWIPGLAVKNVGTFTVPQNLPMPATYWLVVRVWPGPELPKQVRGSEIQITETDHLVLDPDTFVLANLTAVGESPSAPAETVSYQFADGFALYGYELPKEGKRDEPITFHFWWESQTDIQRQLIQFIHLFHENGEDYFVFDQPTFGGRFPPEDWPANTTLMDAVALTLPADLPAGTYRVQTGMYELNSRERVNVMGERVQDFSVVLGSIEIK